MGKFVRKPFRVAGLGEGLRMKKAVDLSLRHARDEITGVDIDKTEYSKYLKKKGLKEKPRNLDVRGRTDAISYLKAQRPESLDHVYAHFLLQHLSFAKRQELLQGAFNALRKGGRFLTVEEMHYSGQLQAELKSQGFEVFAKRLTPEQVFELGTDNAQMNARAYWDRQQLLDQIGQMPRRQKEAFFRERGLRTVEDLKKIDVVEVREFIKARIMEREGENPSPEARKAIDNILAGVSERYSERPFVAIIAKKSRK